MEPIRQYFTAFATDVGMVVKNQDTNRDTKQQRILAVALRIIGMIFAAVSVASFVASVVGAVSAPVAGIIGVILSVALAILAHDLMRIGHNISRHLADVDGIGQGGIGNVIGGVVGVGQRAYNEAVRNTPYTLHDTVIFEPFYRLTHRQ